MNRALFILYTITYLLFPCSFASADDLLLQELLQVGLPVVEIETVNNEMPTAEPINPPPGSIGGSITNATKVPGRVRVWLPDGTLSYDSGDYVKDESGMTVKIRGNWSGRTIKPPYKIKLQKKADLLHRGDDSKYKDKDWLLLRDQFMSLNIKIGLRVNQLMGMQWTPASEYVQVLFNGDFRGLYLLTEAVKRNPSCRLDVDKDTGYIIEYDAYWWNEAVTFKGTFSDTRFRYSFKYPDEDDITDEQLQYITEATRQMEESIVDGTYPDYLDVESFAAWMLAHDILGNSDGGGSNQYITKYDDSPASKFMMGCLWDFDMIMNTPSAWDQARMTNEFYFLRLFNSPNPLFADTYAQLWNERGGMIISAIIEDLNNLSSSPFVTILNEARMRDVKRWEIAHYHPVQDDITAAVKWFIQREAWLNAHIHPRTDDIKSIRTGVPKCSMPLYDLMGRRLAQPLSNTLFIQDHQLFQKR